MYNKSILEKSIIENENKRIINKVKKRTKATGYSFYDYNTGAFYGFDVENGGFIMMFFKEELAVEYKEHYQLSNNWEVVRFLLLEAD